MKARVAWKLTLEAEAYHTYFFHGSSGRCLEYIWDLRNPHTTTNKEKGQAAKMDREARIREGFAKGMGGCSSSYSSARIGGSAIKYQAGP